MKINSKKIVICIFLIINIIYSIYSQENTVLKTRKILLLPTQDATNKQEYQHLRMYIFNVLKSNLNKYENLEVIFLNDNFPVSLYDKDFESIVKGLSEQYTVESFIFGEYFVDNQGLYVFVNVWDAASLRVKNLFMKSMPADLDMLENIDNMCIDIARGVAKELPPLERDILFQKQVLSRLRRQIDREEKLIEDIFKHVHEIQVTPMSGISLGRTIISWSDQGPFMAPLLYVEYSYYFAADFHARI